jgi:hypothetical protein
MIAFVFFLVFSVFIVSETFEMIGNSQQQTAFIQADVSATNFLSYRKAVIDYYNDNPGVTGQVTDGALVPYEHQGFVPLGNWNNVINSDNLFIYTTDNIRVSELKKRLGGSLLLGRKRGGELTSFTGEATGIPLPGSIPDESVVIVGS